VIPRENGKTRRGASARTRLGDWAGNDKKRGSDEPLGSRSLREPRRGFTPSLGAGFGNHHARSRAVRGIVRSGCPERSPSFRQVPSSGSLPTPRNRILSTPHPCPFVKGVKRGVSCGRQPRSNACAWCTTRCGQSPNGTITGRSGAQPCDQVDRLRRRAAVWRLRSRAATEGPDVRQHSLEVGFG